MANAVQSLGTATIINVADKKALGGKLTNLAFPLMGQTLGGKPLSLNATDAIFWLANVGPTIKKGALVKGLTGLAIKKFAEAFDYIDPPFPLNTNDPNATNVTLARQQRAMAAAPMRATYR